MSFAAPRKLPKAGKLDVKLFYLTTCQIIIVRYMD